MVKGLTRILIRIDQNRHDSIKFDIAHIGKETRDCGIELRVA